MVFGSMVFTFLHIFYVKWEGWPDLFGHPLIMYLVWFWPLQVNFYSRLLYIAESSTGFCALIQKLPLPYCSVAFCSTCCHSDMKSLPRSLTRRQHWPLLDIFRDTLSQSCSCSDSSPTRQPTAVSPYGVKPPVCRNTEPHAVLPNDSNDGVEH